MVTNLFMCSDVCVAGSYLSHIPTLLVDVLLPVRSRKDVGIEILLPVARYLLVSAFSCYLGVYSIVLTSLMCYISKMCLSKKQSHSVLQWTRLSYTRIN